MIRNLRRKNRIILLCSAAAVCMAFVAGCKKDQPSPAPPAQAAKAPAPQPKPVQKPVSSVSLVPAKPANQFDFSTKKDPFKPFITIKAAPVQTPDEARKMQRASLPIHSFDVSQFKLIGVIISGKESSQAMVTDPGGKGYVLKVGMGIGKNNGKVVSITTAGVDVVEQFKDEYGRVRKENIKLALPRKQ